jgi:uncharacterized protein
MHMNHCARLVAFLSVALLCVNCSSEHSSAPAPAPTVPNEPASERQAELASAAVDTADALSRSIKLHNAQSARVAERPAGAAAPDAGSVATPATPMKKPVRMSTDGFRDLDWLEMMPKDEVAALDDPKNAIQISHKGSTRTKQFGSSRVVEDLDNQKAQIAGFVVPLESDDQGNMTEFFFVPYYGACIHVPPPPPNQIVYAKLVKGIKTPQIWDPYWLKGVLRARTISNKVAGSAYVMEQAALVPWNG